MSVETLLTRIRQAAAGNTARNLTGPVFEQWTAGQPFARVFEMFRRAVALVAWVHATIDTAHADCRADELKGWQAAQDDGRRYDAAHAPETCAILQRAAEAIRARIEAEGISDPGTVGALNIRVAELAHGLRAHYDRNGEPDELLALRGAIARARAGTWEPSKRLKEARERINVVGLAIGEADVMEAAAALAKAEAVHQALAARLWPEFGVTA